MHTIYFGLVLQLLAIAFGADTKKSEVVRQERQSHEGAQDYYGLLQQLAAQQQQLQQQQPRASATVQQPQQHYSQAVVSRDGDRASAPTRYVLSSDGSIFPDGLGGLGQVPQYDPASLSQAQFGSNVQQYSSGLNQAQLSAGLGQVQYSQGLSQSQFVPSLGQPQQYGQAFGVPTYVQSPLEQTAPQTLPQSPPQPPRPGTRPRISEFARQQQRLLQEFRDAPLRAQIAGLAPGPQPPRPVQPLPTGPNSQSPQVFATPGSQTPRQQQGFVNPLQDPKNAGLVYGGLPVDSQAYFQQFAQLAQQQFAQAQQQFTQIPQQAFTPQYAAVPSNVYAQTPRTAQVPQQYYFQQPDVAQNRGQNPSAFAGSAAIQQHFAQQAFSQGIPQAVPQAVQQTLSNSVPQAVAQAAPQQYLIETTKQSPAQTQFVPQEVTPQIQYYQQPVLAAQSQVTPARQESASPSTLLQPVAGRGYFSAAKAPSRSSIYVSRSSAPRAVSFAVPEGVSSEKVPVVRLQSPSQQRTYTKDELEALVRAGYSVTPVQDSNLYLKTKRQPQQSVEERTNHVVYENPQDGVQYQYSPGTSDSTVSIKTKKSVSKSESTKN